MLKKLKIGLILLLLIKIGCVKPPVEGKSEVYSVLFSFSANIDGKPYHSLRLYIHSDLNKRLSINILLPTNKLIINAFYNGERLIIVDYNNRNAYIDTKKPFDLKKVTGMDVELKPFVDFYNKCYLKKQCDFKQAGEVRFITNSKREIVIVSKRGNILLKPLSGVVKGGVKRLSCTIPEGFKVVYE